MATHKWKDIKKRGKLSPERLDELQREARIEALALTLRELREMAGVTQVELAERTEVSQAELSRAERRGDHLLSTLRRYVEALGGEIEVVARVGDKAVKLRV